MTSTKTPRAPGPIAAEDWFENNLQQVLKIVPKQKLICALGNYGYDWTVPLPDAKGHASQKVIDVESDQRAGGLAGGERFGGRPVFCRR